MHVTLVITARVLFMRSHVLKLQVSVSAARNTSGKTVPSQQLVVDGFT